MNRPETWPKYWEDKTWTVDDTTLTEEELLNAYSALKGGNMGDFLAALGVNNRTQRRCDRALAMLKREGFIAYNKDTRTWEVLK